MKTVATIKKGKVTFPFMFTAVVTGERERWYAALVVAQNFESYEAVGKPVPAPQKVDGKGQLLAQTKEEEIEVAKAKLKPALPAVDYIYIGYNVASDCVIVGARGRERLVQQITMEPGAVRAELTKLKVTVGEIELGDNPSGEVLQDPTGFMKKKEVD